MKTCLLCSTGYTDAEFVARFDPETKTTPCGFCGESTWSPDGVPDDANLPDEPALQLVEVEPSKPSTRKRK